MLDFERRMSAEADDGCKQALTLVFIENQRVEQIYSPENAFVRGTAFPELDKPFKAGDCK